MLVCINGKFIADKDSHVAIQDGAFLYGDSLFETLKAHHKKILLLDEHLDRLELAARILEFPCPRKNIESALTQLTVKLTAPASRIRITLSRGPYQGLTRPAPDQGWFLISATPYEEMDDHKRSQGIICCLAPNRRVNPFAPLPQIKHGNYADCLYARNFAHRHRADEALFIDDSNNLLEGATSNLFALIGNQLVTPPLGTLVLKGIMRQQVLAIAAELQLSWREHPLPLSEAVNADEVFICNSLIDIVPVSRIDQQQINTGQRWRELYKKISQRIDS